MHVGTNGKSVTNLQQLNHAIAACTRCPRLRTYCQHVALQKRAAYRDETYFGLPVPNFGDPAARILLVGLAPAAHGANRTGRMFTGDRSGEFLYRALHTAGLCNQPTCTGPDDGLELHGAMIGAACHCAPPDNKPTTQELKNCAPWLEQTVDLLPDLRVVVCLGGLAFTAMLQLYGRRSWLDGQRGLRFGHGLEYAFTAAPALLCSYHPSQQNTFTGRLTQPMLVAVLKRAALLGRSGINRASPVVEERR